MKKFFLLPVLLFSAGLRAQTVITSFAGVGFSDTSALGTEATPPDSMGAAGTNHFVEFVNGAFAIYSKAGVRQSLSSDISFWTNAGISAATLSSGIGDPRILFDAGSGRWFATEITVDSVNNKILLARSDTADPAGPWKAVSFTGTTGLFADYDTLGVDSLGVYVGVNNFTNGGSFANVAFYSIPKSDLLAATPSLANLTRFDNLDDQTYGFTLQGVSNPDPGGHGVILAVDNAALNFFDRTTINNPGGPGATFSAATRIGNLYDGVPVPAAQPGGNTVDTLDDRFSGSVRQAGGFLFMANTVTNAPGRRNAVHWLVLNETNSMILGEGIIVSNNYDFFQPSIAASRKGKFLVAFNRASNTATNGQISIYGALGSWSSAGASLGAPFLIQQGGVTNFHMSFDSAPYRWGDYSATMVDPADDDLFWTIQEIPVSETAWGTQIALISAATNAPVLSIARNNASVVIKWPLSTDPAYGLQSNTNLLNPNAWASVGIAPVFSTNQNVVTLPRTNAAAFFRLKK